MSKQRMARREFLVRLPAIPVGISAVLGTLGRAAAQPVTAASSAVEAGPVVRAAFLRPPGKYWMGWPGAFYDVDGHQQEWTRLIAEAGQTLGVHVTMNQRPLQDDAQVADFITKTKAHPPEAVLLTLLHMNQWGQVNKIVEAGLPTIIFSPIGMAFTGHFSELSRRPKVYLVSSMDFGAVKYGLKMVRAAYQMANARVVLVAGNERADSVTPNLGTKVRRIPRKRFLDEYNSIGDTAEVKQIADERIAHAQAVREPTRKDVENAARTYIATKRILETEEGDAITMDCLGLVGERLMPTPPCMGWQMVNDEGLTAGCEGDMDACLSLMLVRRLFDRPGFMQDPVPEWPANRFLGAHCTCATRLDGFDKPPAPYILRHHSESDIGVAIQTLWRVGQPITIAQFGGPESMLIYTGTVVGNMDTPPAGGCRTDVIVEMKNLPDARDIQGFHQVLFYGDFERELRCYCQMYNIKQAT